MRELHLFAGIGGGILGGMLLGHRTVCAIEIDPFCRSVLRARQADGVLPRFPILDDVRTFRGEQWHCFVDVVCGGFPCQPWSSAGKRRGAADERHLWPQMARIVAEVRPRYVFAENVAVKAFAEPWRDLRAMGYRLAPLLCLSAADVGAPHLRKRWWLLAADADRQGEYALAVDEEVAGASESAADASSSRLEEREGAEGQRSHTAASGSRWWATEPRVGRVAHGIPARVDRLRALGNAQVPLVAATAFRLLLKELG